MSDENASLIWIPLKGTVLCESRLALRSPAQWVNPLFFFVMIITLFPMAVGPDAELLSQMAVGVIWVAIILSSLLSVGQIFTRDYDSGVLEQLCMSDAPTTLLLGAKVFIHWFFSCAPLIILTPFLSLFLFLDMGQLGILMLTLLLGTPSIALINSVGASITLIARGGSVLLLLICLPLQIPVILFATGAVSSQKVMQAYSGHLAVLLAMLLFFAMLAPFAMTFAIKTSVEEV